jgi:hypothetical protein
MKENPTPRHVEKQAGFYAFLSKDASVLSAPPKKNLLPALCLHKKREKISEESRLSGSD